MKLFTIGFTQKSAETFFGLLLQNGVKRVVDIRINPQGQLAGFAKQEDLPYFLNELANHCHYEYMPSLAPTLEMMHTYRKNGDWQAYFKGFISLMNERQIPDSLDMKAFEMYPSCLLCSEAKPEKCHRLLVAERLADCWPDVEIIHL